MSTTKVKRSQIATFVNTTPTTTATYSLLGLGVTTGKINMNPKTTEETYIDQDTADGSVDSYAPEFPVEQTCVPGDAVYNFVENLCRTRAVLSAAETDIVNVDLYKSSSGGKYPAQKQNVYVVFDSAPGGDGGTPAKINFTFKYRGDATLGSYNPASSSFTTS
jgi:hypothetical protein